MMLELNLAEGSLTGMTREGAVSYADSQFMRGLCSSIHVARS